MIRHQGYPPRHLAVTVALSLLLWLVRGDLNTFVPDTLGPNVLGAWEAAVPQFVAPPPARNVLVPAISQQVADPTRALEKAADQPAEVLVRLQGELDESSARRFFARYNLDLIKRIPRIGVWLVANFDMPAAACVQRLERSGDVSWAEPNGWVYALGITPNDSFYQAQQWNLRLIGLPEAWVFTTGDTRPIAVVDTGIDLDHPDLAAKIWINTDEIADNGEDDDRNGYVDDVHGWNFVHGSTLLFEAPHGTHVAGIAGAHTNNDIGVAGVTWHSTLMALQALNGNGEGAWADVAEAIVYAADNGARIVNLSLGGEESSQTIEDAVSYARGQGCLIVAAAGNNESQPAPVLFPAALPGALAVAATTADDTPWSYSNRGAEVDVAAPGVDIFSTSDHGRYAQMSGTSMAAPHVSGLAALIWSLQPTLSADQVAHVITSTAHDVHPPGRDQYTGWGRIDAQAAVITGKPYRAYLPLARRQSSSEPP